MKNNNLWVGYLTQANKKILVASDDRVDTGNRKTIFLYNQERNDIVEYSREIIQAKLKDAPVEEYNVKEIDAAYQQALRKALPNLYRVVFAPITGGRSPSKESKLVDSTDDNETMDDDIEIDDSFELVDDDDSDDGEDDDLKDL